MGQMEKCKNVKLNINIKTFNLVYFKPTFFFAHTVCLTSPFKPSFNDHELLKKLWEKEKMLVTGVFSPLPTMFFFPIKYTNLHFNPFRNKPWFLLVCSRSRLKTLWEKEKLLVTSNFSSFHNVFGKLSAIFIKFKIVFCQLFQYGKV